MQCNVKLVISVPELPITSLDVWGEEILIHFSRSWQNKGCRHSQVQETLTFYTSLESLYYNLMEGILCEAILPNIKVIWDGLFTWVMMLSAVRIFLKWCS